MIYNQNSAIKLLLLSKTLQSSHRELSLIQSTEPSDFCSDSDLPYFCYLCKQQFDVIRSYFFYVFQFIKQWRGKKNIKFNDSTYWSTVMISRCLVCVRAKRNAKSLASEPELTKKHTFSSAGIFDTTFSAH